MDVIYLGFGKAFHTVSNPMSCIQAGAFWCGWVDSHLADEGLIAHTLWGSQCQAEQRRDASWQLPSLASLLKTQRRLGSAGVSHLQVTPNCEAGGTHQCVCGEAALEGSWAGWRSEPGDGEPQLPHFAQHPLGHSQSTVSTFRNPNPRKTWTNPTEFPEGHGVGQGAGSAHGERWRELASSSLKEGRLQGDLAAACPCLREDGQEGGARLSSAAWQEP